MVFEKLVETTMGVTREDMSQPAFAGLATLSHPELHDVSGTFAKIYNVMSQIKGRPVLWCTEPSSSCRQQSKELAPLKNDHFRGER